MSTHLDASGLSVKRLDTIVEDLGKDLKNNLGHEVDLSSNSVIGSMNSVVGAEIATVWEYLEDVYNAFNIRTAEGFHLDNLVLLGGVTRKGDTYSTGFVQCYGKLNTAISANSFVSTLDKRVFKFDEPLTLTPSVCTELNIDAPVQITLDTNLAVTIQGALYTFPLLGDLQQDFEDAVAGLILEIQTAGDLTYTAEALPVLTSLRIKRTDQYFGSLNISYSSVFTVIDVESQVRVTAVDLGENDIPPEQITYINTPASGWDSVRNDERFIGGQPEETDEQLRFRYFSNLTKATTATYDAIYSELSKLQGVISVQISENDLQSWVQDGVIIPIPVDPEAHISGRLPPHSFECIVYGGDMNEIPQAIWEAKPLGIQTHGVTISDVVDINNTQHQVRWTRPTNSYVWVEVIYTLAEGGLLTPEELTAIQNAIVVYGTTLDVGETVLHQVIIGIVYRTLPLAQILNLSLGLAATVTPTDTPTYAYDANLVIGSGAVSLWDTVRISAVNS